MGLAQAQGKGFKTRIRNMLRDLKEGLDKHLNEIYENNARHKSRI